MWRYQRPPERDERPCARATAGARGRPRTLRLERRLRILLEREGLVVNYKRVHWAAGRQVRRRRRKRLTRADRAPLPTPS
jgi:hypothetical protein